MPTSKLKSTSYTKNNREIRQIFGKNVELKCSNPELQRILIEELSLYPEASEENADYVLEIVSKKRFHSALNKLDDVNYITTVNKVGLACFIFHDSKLSRILYSLNKPLNDIHGWIQRFRNMEFNRREERIGQIIHEQVLVHSVLFEPNLVPIHSSAVKLGEQVILIGGHGGVGKTSLELELCFHKGAHFIADDISPASSSGEIFPNLSYPKIYGYNVKRQPKIEKVIIGSADFMDRFHWKYHFLKGPNKVRRRISPAKLYKNYVNEAVKGNRYMILKRYDGDQFRVEKISEEEISAITIEILKIEFAEILTQLDQQKGSHLEEFRSEAIINRWSKILPEILESIACEVVYIPKEIEHQQFKRKMIEILT